ncbi:hypothetical protein DPMN_055699 [Dreissena polymorpha]|uniref:Uncharacterized protein n=1 Tax=Dreissena polymorpha TaxID=45954 RepID=A0A9D4CRU6_DREPO|nr:hypothetical protein DPMN_055699 [Dreissena polymorpha]
MLEYPRGQRKTLKLNKRRKMSFLDQRKALRAKQNCMRRFLVEWNYQMRMAVVCSWWTSRRKCWMMRHRGARRSVWSERG